jgi:hypothetical protein
MQMNRHWLSFAVPALCASLASPLAAVDRCTTLDLKIPPKWISTTEFDPATKEILIADPKSKSIFAYNPARNGMFKVDLREEISPASITKIHGGFLVKHQDNAVIIGPDRKEKLETNLVRTKGGNPTGLGSLYSNWITKGTAFVGYGSLVRAELTTQEYNPSRGFELGFVYGNVTAESGQFTNLELLEPAEANDYYLFGFPYFAANDDGLFYVRMIGDTASIVQVKKNEAGRRVGKPISVFPSEFRHVEKLKTENVGPSSTKARYAEIEKSTMAVGLFGQGKYLYLLGRRFTGEHTEWSLFKIDPNESKIGREIRLPTTAHHLTVVPGDDSWYLFERGEVKGWGDQEIQRVVKVPASWITDPDNSLLNVGALRVTSCPRLKSARAVK